MITNSSGVLATTSTSTLGLGDGTFLGLSDTPGAFTANALLFASSSGAELQQSSALTYDGTQLGISTFGAADDPGLLLVVSDGILGSSTLSTVSFDRTKTVQFRHYRLR